VEITVLRSCNPQTIQDVGNRPTIESISSYTAQFGDDYFSFWVNGVKCIVLNLSLYSDPSGAPGTLIQLFLIQSQNITISKKSGSQMN
jgi:hypothetical protein